jgi:SAM-dependent methyltransferase
VISVTSTTTQPIAKWTWHASMRRRNLALIIARARFSMAGLRDKLMLDSGLKGKNVMDLGCGGGRPILAALAKRVIGLEPNYELATQARQIYFMVLNYRIEDLLIHDTLYLSEFFDSVVSTDVLGHVKDKELFLSEAHRLLKPGGVTIHVAETFAPFNWICRRAIRDTETYQRNWEDIPDHRYLLWAYEYKELFRQEFSDVEVTPLQAWIPECGIISVLLKGTPGLPLWLRGLRWLDEKLAKRTWTRELTSLLLTPVAWINRFAPVEQGLGVIIKARKI